MLSQKQWSPLNKTKGIKKYEDLRIVKIILFCENVVLLLFYNIHETCFKRLMGKKILGQASCVNPPGTTRHQYRLHNYYIEYIIIIIRK